MSTLVVYKCRDGTDFPVGWPDPEDANATWYATRDHYPEPVVPLAGAANKLGQSAFDGAFHELDMVVPPPFRGMVIANGWAFMRGAPMTPDELRHQEQAITRLVEKIGGPGEVWEQVCLPEAIAACDRLAQAPVDTPIATLAGHASRAFGETMVAAMVLFQYVRPLSGLCKEEFGEGSDLLAFDLTQGYPNATLDCDQELWRMAQLAKGSPKLRSALTSGESPTFETIRRLDGEGEFTRRFESFLQVYGRRAQEWQIISPTWVERTDIPLALVARYIVEGSPSPSDAIAAAAERREASLTELESRLSDKPQRRETLRQMTRQLACYVPVREGRALWQLIAQGSLRLALLRVGDRLARDQRIEKDEDVFFLEPGEIETPGKGQNLRTLVEIRRADWERSRRIDPPPFIGAAPQDPNSQPRDDGASPDVIKGIAASRGVHSGVARVLRGPDEAARLAPGDVLVCVMTSPTWTPLFGIAGAVVTETGGLLSHPSIAAREYGIPCVVAAPGATQRIRDGARVTVDGAKATIRIEGLG